MKGILFSYAMSIILSMVFLNVSDAFFIQDINASGKVEYAIYGYVAMSLFFSPLTFFIIPAFFNEKK
ncbi:MULTISPECIES: hypothetical protein [Pectobacterium]|uniref:hypothetical protein n=1 Tax=Pectobacterium TaxID=122277 RepID=UPI0018DA8BB0|nr:MULTISPECIES: hypothetical protein [Pectobacterium]QPI44562.1 hypothetical protein I2D83_08325 [Pectobacterium aroidearum]